MSLDYMLITVHWLIPATASEKIATSFDIDRSFFLGGGAKCCV